MKRIAIYGKGGIGKSTLACNLSAALAQRGQKVLQIGCDPKADSTRLLTGKKIPDVLSQLNSTSKALTKSHILFRSCIKGVYCIEAGGPQAGVGCAGMGITAMENELQRLGILDMNWDIILYDVLGDVVCGGFAMPMRQHFADQVYIVSSSEYMSVYAANNILKAIDYYSYNGKCMFGGMIWNHCRDAFDDRVSQSFAQKTGTFVAARIPESALLRKEDYSGILAVQNDPSDAASQAIRALAQQILASKSSEGSLHPLTDEELERWRRSLAQQA